MDRALTYGKPRSASGRRAFFAVLFGGGLLAGNTACEPERNAAVILHVETNTAARPFSATLDWLSPAGAIFRALPIPESGAFPLSGNTLADVFIEKGSHPLGPRRAFVVGRIDARVFWGTARVNLIAKEWVDATVLIEERAVPDADGDTIPDVIDDCNGTDDRSGCPL